MTSQALISKIRCTLSADQKRESEFNNTTVIKFLKANKQELSTGKSSFLRVVGLIQVRSGWYGITILQFFRYTGRHDCL